MTDSKSSTMSFLYKVDLAELAYFHFAVAAVSECFLMQSLARCNVLLTQLVVVSVAQSFCQFMYNEPCHTNFCFLSDFL